MIQIKVVQESHDQEEWCFLPRLSYAYDGDHYTLKDGLNIWKEPCVLFY